MNVRGHCFENVTLESFFSLLERARVRRRIYRTGEEAKADLFGYIEWGWNASRDTQTSH